MSRALGNLFIKTVKTNSVYKKSISRNFSISCQQKGHALIYTGYGDPAEVLKLTEVPDKKPEANQVAVKWLLSAVNPADINTLQGKYPSRPSLPAIAGNEGVGEVAEVGGNVTDLKVGDRVVPNVNNIGTWATRGTYEPDLLMKNIVHQPHARENDKWTDVSIAIVNSGSFKTHYEGHSKITMNDVYSIVAYDDIIGIVSLTGRQLLNAFEHGAFNITYNDFDRTEYVDGRLLQASGIKMSYDLSKPGGSKIVPNSVFVRCADCKVPVYQPLDENKTYKAITLDFLHKGKDGFDFIADLPWQSLDVTMREVFSKYVERISPIYIGEEGRITYVNQ